MPRWLVIALAVVFLPITVIVLIVRSRWTGRTKAILTTAWIGFLLILSAAGSSGSPSSTQTTDKTTTAEVHTAAPDLAPTPSPSPSPPPPISSPASPQAFVKFLNSLAARRGANVTASVQTTPNTECRIEVDYKSGPSKAQGLYPKTSSSTGAVSWTWKVGSTTTPGSWPVIVTCGEATAQTVLQVS